MSDLGGLSTINVELCSRCDKACAMCGRRKVDRDFPQIAMDYGDAPFDMLQSIADQLPGGIVVQFHKDGESLLYPKFGEAIRLFNRQIRCLTSNGNLLVEKAEEVIDGLDTLSISLFEGDPDTEKQLKIIERFMTIKGDKKPYTVLRALGNVDFGKYAHLNMLIVKRVFHKPMGSFGYIKKSPTIPEIGICLEALHHPCISVHGDFSICVRFDPHKFGVLGNVKKERLVDIWNSPKRMEFLELHKTGNRARHPLCAQCEFWGVPTST